MPTIAEARQSFTDLLNRAHYKSERIDVTRRHIPHAAIVSSEDKLKLNVVDPEQTRSVADIEDMQQKAQELDRLLSEWKCATPQELRKQLAEFRKKNR